jgi:hypothetical protein
MIEQSMSIYIQAHSLLARPLSLRDSLRKPSGSVGVEEVVGAGFAGDHPLTVPLLLMREVDAVPVHTPSEGGRVEIVYLLLAASVRVSLEDVGRAALLGPDERACRRKPVGCTRHAGRLPAPGSAPTR